MTNPDFLRVFHYPSAGFIGIIGNCPFPPFSLRWLAYSKDCEFSIHIQYWLLVRMYHQLFYRRKNRSKESHVACYGANLCRRHYSMCFISRMFLISSRVSHLIKLTFCDMVDCAADGRSCYYWHGFVIDFGGGLLTQQANTHKGVGIDSSTVPM